MDIPSYLIILVTLSMVGILYILSQLHLALLEIRSELRLHNSREVRRDLRAIEREHQERT